MTTAACGSPSIPKIDPAELFRKLGLVPADERPILQGWREANNQWRRDRLRKIAEHAQRVQEHLRRFRHPRPPRPPLLGRRMGKKRAVWCVELKRKFATMTAAATFVGREASNISQSLSRGVRCGPYHWEEYDAARHR